MENDISNKYDNEMVPTPRDVLEYQEELAASEIGEVLEVFVDKLNEYPWDEVRTACWMNMRLFSGYHGVSIVRAIEVLVAQGWLVEEKSTDRDNFYVIEMGE